MFDGNAIRPVWRGIAAVSATLLWTVLSASSVSALVKAEAVTLDYQVQHSDIIVRGTCADSATTFSNNHFVTTYKVVVKKYLKAPGKMSVESHPVLLVSQLGGRISTPIPLEESYPEMAALYGGEEVVLFLQSPQTVAPTVRARYDQYLAEGKLKPSPLMTNYRLTTMNVSKLSVVKNPTTGQEVVTRVNFDRLGVLPSEEAARSYLQALESQKRFMDVKRGDQTVRIPVQPGPLIPAATPAAPPRIEEKIRQMQSFTTTWDNFQRQVESIQRGEKSSAPVPVGGAPSAPPTRTFPSRQAQ